MIMFALESIPKPFSLPSPLPPPPIPPMLHEEHRKKLKDCNLLDACKISNSEKNDDITLWPCVNLGNIF